MPDIEQNTSSVDQVQEKKNTADIPSVQQRKNFSMRVLFLLVSIVIVLILGWLLFTYIQKQQQSKKVYRIGVISGAVALSPIVDSFKKHMVDLGYNEGTNIIYDTQSFDNNPESEKKAIQKFVQDKVDLIFSLPTRPSEEAKEATKGTNIPIVFGAAGIEGTNLVDSVTKPGGNITGIRIFSPENTVKRLELLHELAPQAKRVNVIYSHYQTVPANLEMLRKAAPQFGITLVETPVVSIAEAKDILDARAKQKDLGIDAILIIPEALMSSPPSDKMLGDFSKKYKIPVTVTIGGPNSENILFGYNLNFDQLGANSAVLVDKVLKGTQAGTIPVVSPDSELWINYKVAQALGLTINEGILSNAKKIIR